MDSLRGDSTVGKGTSAAPVIGSPFLMGDFLGDLAKSVCKLFIMCCLNGRRWWMILELSCSFRIHSRPMLGGTGGGTCLFYEKVADSRRDLPALTVSAIFGAGKNIGT